MTVERRQFGETGFSSEDFELDETINNSGVISDELKSALKDNRRIDFRNYNEQKVVSVRYDNKIYNFYCDTNGWTVEIADNKGDVIEMRSIYDDSDVKYLEQLFIQDIPDALRDLLKTEGKTSYEDYGETMLISVRHNGMQYSFYPSSREYAAWAMRITNEKEEIIADVDIREESDVQFLEILFAKFRVNNIIDY